MSDTPMALVEPTYTDAGAGVTAAFPSGARLDVQRNRLRRYPGLPGPAPVTAGFYESLAEAAAGATRVIDWGCGAGVGLAVLRKHFPHVVGFDVDEQATSFARQHVPGVQLEWPGQPADASAAQAEVGFVVDVLGFAEKPAAVLRQVRRRLGPRGRLLLAEPRAHGVQLLSAPARRAFSESALSQLLVRAGFAEPCWLGPPGRFLVASAEVDASRDWETLEQAELAIEAGDPQRALELYSSIQASVHERARGEVGIGMAMSWARLGNLDAACHHLLELARETAVDPRPSTGLSEVTCLVGDHASALRLATTAMEIDSADSKAARAMATAASGIDAPEAVSAWRVANALDPSEPRAAIPLAQAQAAQGELGSAIWTLERLREYGAPETSDMRMTLGWLYLSAGRVKEAALEADLLRVEVPDSPALLELQQALAAAREES